MSGNDNIARERFELILMKGSAGMSAKELADNPNVGGNLGVISNWLSRMKRAKFLVAVKPEERTDAQKKVDFDERMAMHDKVIHDYVDFTNMEARNDRHYIHGRVPSGRYSSQSLRYRIDNTCREWLSHRDESVIYREESIEEKLLGRDV